MARQERTAKKQKAAKKQADKIVEEAIAEKRRKAPAKKAAAQRKAKKKKDDDLVAIGHQVKEKRDSGMAWWKIAHELGLPGSAPNVAQGKSGANYARKAYRAAFGDVPRSQAVRGTRKEKNDTVRGVRARTREDRVAAVRAGEAVLGHNVTDAEIVAAVEGRRIVWTVNTSEIGEVKGKRDEFVDQDAWVHPHNIRVEEYGENDRILKFREMDPKAPQEYRALSGMYRTVRISRIHTIGASA